MQLLGFLFKKDGQFQPSRHVFGYAERSKAFNLLDAETHGVVVSKNVVFDKIAEWYPSSEISGSIGNTDDSTHHVELGLESDTQVPEVEDEMTTRMLDSGSENSYRLRMMKMDLSMLQV